MSQCHLHHPDSLHLNFVCVFFFFFCVRFINHLTFNTHETSTCCLLFHFTNWLYLSSVDTLLSCKHFEATSDVDYFTLAYLTVSSEFTYTCCAHSIFCLLFTRQAALFAVNWPNKWAEGEVSSRSCQWEGHSCNWSFRFVSFLSPSFFLSLSSSSCTEADFFSLFLFVMHVAGLLSHSVTQSNFERQWNSIITAKRSYLPCLMHACVCVCYLPHFAAQKVIDFFLSSSSS